MLTGLWVSLHRTCTSSQDLHQFTGPAPVHRTCTSPQDLHQFTGPAPVHRTCTSSQDLHQSTGPAPVPRTCTSSQDSETPGLCVVCVIQHVALLFTTEYSTQGQCYISVWCENRNAALVLMSVIAVINTDLLQTMPTQTPTTETYSHIHE